MLNKVWIIALLFIGGTASAQKIKTLFEAETLFGKVREVTSTAYVRIIRADGMLITDSLVKNISSYDINGNILVNFSYITSFSNGIRKLRLYNKTVYKRSTDSNGQTRIDAYSNGRQVAAYILDKDGNVIETDGFKEGKQLSFKCLFTYDDTPNQVVVKYYDANANPTFERKYRFDGKGNGLGYDDYHGDKITNTNQFKINEVDMAGNWIKRTATGSFANATPFNPRIMERKILYY